MAHIMSIIAVIILLVFASIGAATVVVTLVQHCTVYGHMWSVVVNCYMY